MAKALVALRMGFALVAGILVGIGVVGCQQSKSTIVQKLPTPSLDGPVVKNAAPAPKVAPATRPVNSAPTMATAQKSRGERGGVPQEWLITVPANSWQY